MGVEQSCCTKGQEGKTMTRVISKEGKALDQKPLIGDTILKVDGEEASDIWLPELAGLLRTLPGERSSCSEVLAMPLFGTPQDPNECREYTEYKHRSNISSENDVTSNEKLVGSPQSPERNDDSAKSTCLSGASTRRVDTQSQAEAPPPSQEYEIKTKLGQGAQGMVWHAIMNSDGRHVVIKSLHRHHLLDINSDDSAKQEKAKIFWGAFRNEIGILEACSGHPNIIQIFGRASDYSQIFLEKADMDLNTRLRASGTSLSLDQCHRWSKDLLCGVGHLHALGVTHTDLKPANLLIGNENLKICDLGFGHKHAPGTQWAVNGELSTLWYRAPELLLGSKTFDYKIDLWAIGCIMMEMLSGAAVFQGQKGPQFASPCPDVTHHNFNSDQVHKVLSMAGTPASLAGFECASLIKGWPPFQRHVEPTVVRYCEAKGDAKGNSSASWAQTIGGLLRTLPGERSSCSEVLAMPLFGSWGLVSKPTLSKQARCCS